MYQDSIQLSASIKSTEQGSFRSVIGKNLLTWSHKLTVHCSVKVTALMGCQTDDLHVKRKMSRKKKSSVDTDCSESVGWSWAAKSKAKVDEYFKNYFVLLSRACKDHLFAHSTSTVKLVTVRPRIRPPGYLAVSWPRSAWGLFRRWSLIKVAGK